jgi:hypothetical protein
MDDDRVSTSVDAAVTVTFSATLATLSVKSSVIVWETFTGICLLDAVVKPVSSASTS